ncbi:MAG: hypothetical protein GY847_04050 [Proteobacteria bacterium]|nr:hypothetical protein [Pseudomonadota bacterium]
MKAPQILFSPVVFLLFIAALTACGKDRAEKETKNRAFHRGLPVKSQKRPNTKQIKINATPAGRRELFAAEIRSVKGNVESRSQHLQGMHPAVGSEKLFGGAVVDTGSNGKAMLALRGMGEATLDQNSRMIISRYTRSGAVLVCGGLLLECLPDDKTKKTKRYLHTPAVAILTTGSARILIAVADSGQTRIGALAGQVSYVDIQGQPRTLSAGKQITIDADGSPGKTESLMPVKVPAEQYYREWIEKSAPARSERPALADSALKRTEKIARRLELDVDRLIELMNLNKKVSEERRGIDENEKGVPGRREKLTALLIEQAREMVDLKEKGMLQIQRLVALAELADGPLTGDRGVEKRRVEKRRVGERRVGERRARKRIISLNRRLEAMRQRLPPLFDRS